VSNKMIWYIKNKQLSYLLTSTYALMNRTTFISMFYSVLMIPPQDRVKQCKI